MATRPRTRLDPEARRAQLVGLGLAMLSTRPLDQVAVDDIAAEAGISRGLLFHYFPTKREFHVAVVRAAADELLDRTAPDPARPVEEQLRAGIEAFLDHVSGNRDAYVALVRSSGGDPDLQAVFEATRARIAERVLEALGAPGPPSPRLRMAVRGWVALVEEVVVGWITTGDLGRDDVIAFLEHALGRLVALAAAPGG